jgi:hypothetical protein
MSNNIYDIMAKLNSISAEPKQEETAESLYENVEPRGSIINAVKSLATKYEDFVAKENKQIDETQFSDKETFDKLAGTGDTYKTADGGTVTKTEKGIKHSAPAGRYGAGPEDDKDELDENTSENTLEESQADLRNHPIYTNEEAWNHYQKELAEANAEKEETVDIQDELNELNRLAGLAEKVGGNKSHGFVDDVTGENNKKCESCGCETCECDVNEGFDPKDFSGEMDWEFTGDDGETGYGSISYQAHVLYGELAIDPLSLRAHCKGDGNNKLTDEWCAEMVAPGGSEHDAAMEAAHEDATEAWQERDVDVPMGEEALAEGPTRKDFQMVADLLKNIEDETKKVELANHHADMFAKQNPRFDKARFLSAVGLSEETQLEEAQSPAQKAAFQKMLDAKKGKTEDKDETVSEEKPDFLDLDKDGDKEEPMKKAAKDAVKEDINVTVNASGEQDALKLMMRLAGVQAVAVQAEEAIEEEREVEYDNTPDEQVASVSAAIPSGTDLHKAKKSYPKVAGGDNPMALEDKDLEESLWTNYQDMIKEVKKDENA